MSVLWKPSLLGLDQAGAVVTCEKKTCILYHDAKVAPKLTDAFNLFLEQAHKQGY